jgi:ethanolamine utilization protein EutA
MSDIDTESVETAAVETGPGGRVHVHQDDQGRVHLHAHDHGNVDHHHDEDLWTDDPEHPLWGRDQIVLTSVGIDIGSATTQFLFSELTLRRMGREMSSAFAVVAKEVVYESPVWSTPYGEGLTIDEGRLAEYVAEAFNGAGMTPRQVDTGAVILTGEAARRHNAQAIAELFAGDAGHFVCATAGHHLEARMAAAGSGALALSGELGTVLNVDTGGGTTKLTLLRDGEIIWTGALHVGGRLVHLDEAGRVDRLEPAAERFAGLAGGGLALGQEPAPGLLDEMAALMATVVIDSIRDIALEDSLDWTKLTGDLPQIGPVDAIVFSGGVGAFVNDEVDDDQADLGRRLGERFRAAAETGLPGPVHRVSRAIRATVIGASQFTVQVSGNTIHVPDPALLPMRNLRVLSPPGLDLSGDIRADEVESRLIRHWEESELSTETPIALGFRWSGVPSFARLEPFVTGVHRAATRMLPAGAPLVVLIQGDIARTVGGILEDQGYESPLLVIDGITVTDFDFTDIGEVFEKSGVVPVTLKSMLFSL